jgi:hypothetical protein
LLTTLREQTRTYLAENVTGLSAEEAAVTAFLSLRLGELEKERKNKMDGSALAAESSNQSSRSAIASRITSMEVLPNQ